MKRRAEQIMVEVTESGNVRLSQDGFHGGDVELIVTYEQIPQLVGWLRAAEAEIDEQRRTTTCRENQA